MRPNIEIPWSVHGQIKQYANEEDISLDEAYKNTLENGIANLSMPTVDVTERTDTHEPTWTVHTPLPDEAKKAHVTYIPGLNDMEYNESRWLSVSMRRHYDNEEFVHALNQLGGVLSKRAVTGFSFVADGDLWTGRGIPSQFLEAVPNYSAPFTITIHPDEHVVCIITGSSYTDEFGNIEMTFLTDGVPVDASNLLEIANVFDTNSNPLQNAHKTRVPSARFAHKSAVSVDESDVLGTEVNGENLATTVAIENPTPNALVNAIAKESPELEGILTSRETVAASVHRPHPSVEHIGEVGLQTHRTTVRNFSQFTTHPYINIEHSVCQRGSTPQDFTLSGE